MLQVLVLRPRQEPRRAALSRRRWSRGCSTCTRSCSSCSAESSPKLLNGGSLGPFWNTLFESSSTTYLLGSELKAMMYGAIIAIVCCYKGMSASGGAEGVGRAVNEAVVISFLGIGAFGYAFTQTLLATHPQILVIR